MQNGKNLDNLSSIFTMKLLIFLKKSIVIGSCHYKNIPEELYIQHYMVNYSTVFIQLLVWWAITSIMMYIA